MIVDSLNGNVNDRVKTTTKNVWLIFTVTSMNLMKNNDSNSCLDRTFLFFFILFIACHQCKCRHKQMLGCFYYRIIYTACKRNRNNTHKYLGMKKYIKHSNAKISNHIYIRSLATRPNSITNTRNAIYQLQSLSQLSYLCKFMHRIQLSFYST